MPEKTPIIPGTPTSTLEPVPSPIEIRAELEKMVIKDLLGPAGGPDEELDQREDRVRERYLVGMLAPRKTVLPGETIDSLGTSDSDDVETGASEAPASGSDTFIPNSIGLSFVVDLQARGIAVKAEWGAYERV